MGVPAAAGLLISAFGLLTAGTFAVLSLMTGSVVERVVPEPLAGNLSGIEREKLEAQRIGAAAAVAFGSGALMVSERGSDPVRTLGDGSTEKNQNNWARGWRGGEEHS